MDRNNVINKHFVIIFCGALLGLILSKGGVFIPSYSVDDYGSALRVRGASQLIGQKRFVYALLQLLIMKFKITSVGVSWPATIIFFISYSTAISFGLIFTFKEKIKTIELAVIAAFIAAFPYLAFYFYFREAILSQGIVYIFLAFYFYILNTREKNLNLDIKSFCICIILLILILGMQQLVFFVIIQFLLFKYCCSIITKEYSAKKLIFNNINLSIFVAVILYIIIAKYFSLKFGFLNERAKLLEVSQLPDRIEQIRLLLKQILFSKEPSIPLITKRYIYLIVLGALIYPTIKKPIILPVAVCTFLLAVFLSIILVSMGSVWWPATRAYYIVGNAYGLFLALFFLSQHKKISVYYTNFIILGTILYSFHSAMVFHDQYRNNNWDRWTSGAIVQRLIELDVSPETQVLLVNPKHSHYTKLSTTSRDTNMSVLAVNGAISDVFQDTTGIKWNVKLLKDREICKNSVSWPHKDSIFIKEGKAIVCF